LSSDSSKIEPETPLAKSLKVLNRDSHLAQDLKKERRANLVVPVNRYCHGPSIAVIPSFVAACLAGKNESKKSGDALEIARLRARH